MRVLRASIAAFLLFVGLAPAVFAVTMTMTTPYPALVADPGTVVDFPVTVQTDSATRVDLSTTQSPQGWQIRFQGGGSTVTAVQTAPYVAAAGSTPYPVANGNYASFTVQVEVPAAATGGDNQIVVQGKATDGTTQSITLDVNVQTASTGDVTMSTSFPTLSGPATTTFRFSVQLNNNTNQQVTFQLSTDQPAGWTVTATPSTNTNAASAVIDAGSSQDIAVVANAPDDATSGSYTITLSAAGGPSAVSQDLTVQLTGTQSLTLDTSDQLLNVNVTAGQASTMNFVVTNTGTQDLTGVALDATPPIDWTVTFNPTSVDIPAGQDVTVQASITPANDALAGDYTMTVNARNPDSSASASQSIRATVQTSPIAYVIGIVILVVVAVGLFFVFQRYGRR